MCVCVFTFSRVYSLYPFICVGLAADKHFIISGYNRKNNNTIVPCSFICCRLLSAKLLFFLISFYMLSIQYSPSIYSIPLSSMCCVHRYYYIVRVCLPMCKKHTHIYAYNVILAADESIFTTQQFGFRMCVCYGLCDCGQIIIKISISLYVEDRQTELPYDIVKCQSYSLSHNSAGIERYSKGFVLIIIFYK